MSLQAPLENGQWRCRNDVSRQVVPDARCNSEICCLCAFVNVVNWYADKEKLLAVTTDLLWRDALTQLWTVEWRWAGNMFKVMVLQCRNLSAKLHSYLRDKHDMTIDEKCFMSRVTRYDELALSSDRLFHVSSHWTRWASAQFWPLVSCLELLDTRYCHRDAVVVVVVLLLLQ